LQTQLLPKKPPNYTAHIKIALRSGCYFVFDILGKSCNI
jgi:hypothetical protein